MFAIIWWVLPGGRFLKTLQLILALLVIVLASFWWLFPWIVDYFNLSQNTVNNATSLRMYNPFYS